MTPGPVAENRTFGIGLMISAMFTMTAMDAAVKWAVADYSLQQVNFIRSIAAMLVLVPLICRMPRFRIPRLYGAVVFDKIVPYPKVPLGVE